MSGQGRPLTAFERLAMGVASAFLAVLSRLLSAPAPKPWPDPSRPVPTGQEASE